MSAYDNIRELTFFLRVSEEASFSAAARSLDLDPSTISKVIQRLEDRLGVRLFHRTSRVLQLTQEGERFLAAAQKVAQALEEADESLNPAMNEVSGLLRIGSSPAFARFWLAPLMPDFCATHPKLKIEFVSSPTPQNLIEQQIDVAFQHGAVPDSTLIARRMSTVRWRIYGSPSYLERHGVPRVPDDLATHRCLNYLPGSYRSQWQLNDGKSVRTFSPTGPVAASDGDVICTLAVAGMGLARLIDARASAEVKAGRLVAVLDDCQTPGEPVFAVYPSRRHLSLRVRAFLDYLGERSGAE
jgi:DNA-binding transcriptional LysR family regulator